MTPEQLATKAMSHGGFTTPAIEAYRFLFDACCAVRRGKRHGEFFRPSPERAADVREVLVWIDRNPRSALDALHELERLSEVFGLGWRMWLEKAL